MSSQHEVNTSNTQNFELKEKDILTIYLCTHIKYVETASVNSVLICCLYQDRPTAKQPIKNQRRRSYPYD